MARLLTTLEKAKLAALGRAGDIVGQLYNDVSKDVSELEQEVSAIELTPGPAGPAGPEGPAGGAGADALYYQGTWDVGASLTLVIAIPASPVGYMWHPNIYLDGGNLNGAGPYDFLLDAEGSSVWETGVPTQSKYIHLAPFRVNDGSSNVTVTLTGAVEVGDSIDWLLILVPVKAP